MSDEKRAPLIKIGSLWRNRRGEGASGKMGDGKYAARLVLLPNSRVNRAPGAPDYELFVTRNEPRPGQAEKPEPAGDDEPF